ncbi:MAG: tyrosine-type recombinase/integrase [Deltaproteobacteria bacterium]|nr:tyrosine-type recombinase/integrase [Deltaproteobacteria bacterium]
MNKFKSFLAPQLQQYLIYRHNLGYSMKTSLSHLKTFDRYLKQKQAEQVLLQPSFFMLLQADLTIEARSVNAIVTSVRVFFNYLVRTGAYSQNPLKDIPYLPENDIMPYIFSPKQVNHLLSAVSNRIRKVSQHIYLKDLSGYMAMVLLARCGLRIGEPLRMKLNHYRFDEKTIYIEKTKFKKDRLIPLPQSVAVEFENYLAARHCLLAGVDNKYLLANSTGKGLTDHRVRTVFHWAVNDIGLKQPRQIIGNVNISSPTPHSLRHAFAVNTLNHVKKRGGSAQNALPVLAAYMGHSEYKHTIKYLKFIDAQQRLELVNFIGTHPDQQ